MRVAHVLMAIPVMKIALVQSHTLQKAVKGAVVTVLMNKERNNLFDLLKN